MTGDGTVRLRRAGERAVTRTGWLDSRHTFSFGAHHDPAWMGFGLLRVLNDDRVAPAGGFGTHGHANMEIVSLVLSGALAHRDSTGSEGVIQVDEVQCMSAGHGIRHSEFNASQTEPVRFLQIWIQPDRVNAEPRHHQARAASVPAGHWQRLVGEDALPIRQRAVIERMRLDAGQDAIFEAAAGTGSWLQVLAGDVTCSALEGETLQPGDGLSVARSGPHRLQAATAADILRIDVPLA